MILYKQKTAIIFCVVFIHNTLLDLFTKGGVGWIFYWEKSLEAATILTHLLIAALVAIIFAISMKCRQDYPQNISHIRDKVWALCSVFLLLTIYFTIF